MKLIAQAGYRTIMAAAAVLLLGDAAAQTTLRTRELVPTIAQPSGPKPTLIAPAAGVQIQSSPNRRKPVLHTRMRGDYDEIR